MKITTAPQNVAILNKDNSTGIETEHIQAHKCHREVKPPQTAEERLTERIFQDGSGKALIKFCRELSLVLIRNYSSKDDTEEMRSKLSASLMVTLNCTKVQSLSLIELSLELLHAKVKGKYRRSEVELSFLIASAIGAVSDVGSN